MQTLSRRPRSPIEQYAEARGIELTPDEVAVLENDHEMVGMVSRAMSESMDPNSRIATQRAPWQTADALGAPGHTNVLTLEGKPAKVDAPDNEDANRIALAMRAGEITNPEEITAVFGEPDPIVPRSHAERLDEVTKLLVDFYDEHKFIPASILREIQGIYFAAGQPQSADDLRAVAAFYLNRAMAEGQTTEPSMPARLK